MNRSIDRGSRWRVTNPCRKSDPSAAAEVRGDMKQTLPCTSSCEIKTTCSIQDIEAGLKLEGEMNVYLQE